MNMNKRILSSAISMVLAGGVGVAHADVDLANPPAGVVTFANEANVNATGTPVLNGPNITAGGDIITVLNPLGFSIGDGTSKYVRYDLVNAQFGVAAGPGNLDVPGGSGTTIVSQGGQPGDTFVIFEVSASGGDIGLDNPVFFRPGAGGPGTIAVTNKQDGTIQYRLFETAVDAVAETGALSTISGTWFTWGTGLNVSCANAPSKLINVIKPTEFVDLADPTSTNVFSMTMTAADNTYDLDGTPVTPVEAFPGGTEAVVTGNFAAFIPANGGDASLDGNGGAPIEAGSATFNVGPFGPPPTRFMEVIADGTTPMGPGQYSVVVTPGAGALNTDPIDLGVCGDLQFSGSTDRIDMVTNPSGAFDMFVRVTNPSNQAGRVFMVVTNDDGVSSGPFPLDTVTGQPDSLDAGASTALISNADLLAAAQSFDPTFTIGNGKMRVEVRGEWGEDARETAANNLAFVGTLNQGATLVGRTVAGIAIQGYTLSTDSSAFIQTQ